MIAEEGASLIRQQMVPDVRVWWASENDSAHAFGTT
jgi:hypothetical protein